MRILLFSLFFISFFINGNHVYSQTKKTPSFIQESKSSKLLDQEVLDRYSEENPWGMNVSIDLYETDPKLIRDPKYVKKL